MVVRDWTVHFQWSLYACRAAFVTQTGEDGAAILDREMRPSFCTRPGLYNDASDWRSCRDTATSVDDRSKSQSSDRRDQHARFSDRERMSLLLRDVTRQLVPKTNGAKDEKQMSEIA